MKLILLVGILLPFANVAQNDQGSASAKQQKISRGLGIKGGVNFANVRNASSINTSNQTGFMGGVFFAPPSKRILGYRSELIYSKQGYNFETQSTTGNVHLDYIILPNLMTINITKFLQLQLGAQVAYLLNAKTDSTEQNSQTPSGYNSNAMDMYNRFDYGIGAGIELQPVGGLIIGARMNFGLANIYKDPSSYQPGTAPAMLPKLDVKNNVLQLSVGWIF